MDHEVVGDIGIESQGTRVVVVATVADAAAAAVERGASVPKRRGGAGRCAASGTETVDEREPDPELSCERGRVCRTPRMRTRERKRTRGEVVVVGDVVTVVVTGMVGVVIVPLAGDKVTGAGRGGGASEGSESDASES